MNASEATYGAEAMVAVRGRLGVGVRTAGARALDHEGGTARLATGLRVLWQAGRTQTGFELPRGVLGDPFGLRGSLETTIRFR